jgi:short subunit dehydrogenase-like uncharacterized protein
MSRTFDITVYGATGFTGRQLIKHLCLHAPAGTKLAVAGRNRAKLQAVIAQLPRRDIGIAVADAADRERVHALCADTRVVANTAGPFALHGTAVVAGCALAGTHYVDITGETPWVRDLIDRFHAQAVATGAKIVPCCGYDSCPSDLGAWLVTQHLRRTYGEDTLQVEALQSLRGGGLNGGTAASAFALAESGRLAELADPFLLSPGFVPNARVREQSRDPGTAKWHARSQRFIAPFFMGPVNSRVVRRSAFLFAEKGHGYGRDFVYQEYWSTRSRLFAYGMAAANLAGHLAAQRKWLVQAAARLAPKPGEGPSETAMDNASFKTVLYGEGEKGTRVCAEISGPGDAGNRVTIAFLGEAALALAAGETACEGGGILTPAFALGAHLLGRVRGRGMVANVQE